MRILSALLLTHFFCCVILKGNYTKRGYQRKLLIYDKQDFFKYNITSENDRKRPLKETASQYLHPRQRKQSDFDEDTDETDDEFSDDWDDWGEWSPCTVTCGCGQQVRWRHCITDKCTKGLKRAQIKTCHLRPCDNGFLNWLGIKM